MKIDFDEVTSDRDRVLKRAELAELSGRHPDSFTSEAVIAKSRIDEARDQAAAAHAPWESNFFTGRSGRRYHLSDVPEGER